MTKRNTLLTPNSLPRRSALVGGAGLLGLGLAACGATPRGDSGSGDGGDSGGGPEGKTITLGYIASWTDGLSTAYLLDNRLTAMGYTVEHQTIAEAALLYNGLSQGDVNIYPSAWPEVTHADYMEEYGDGIEDLIGYYEGAKLNLSVPDYMDDVTVDPGPQGPGRSASAARSSASSPAPDSPAPPRTTSSPATVWTATSWSPPRPRRCSPSCRTRSMPRRTSS